MSDFIFPQDNGQNLVITYSQSDSGRGNIAVKPDQGVLFSKQLSDGRKIDALSLQWNGGFLALVEYKIDDRYAAINDQDLPYTRVDLQFGGKVLDIFEEDPRQFFLEQIGNINACLQACAGFVKQHMIPASGEKPKLDP
jgi:hypothetical protein